MTLTYAGSRQLEGDVRTFIFTADKATNWTAGQFLHVTLKHDNPDDRGDERWFTISSAPSDNEITISTRIVAGRQSTFKQALAALKPGDTIEADEPGGDFVLTDNARNYIFVAGGIGITPFHSIIKELVAQGTLPAIKLLHANQTTDVPFKAELDAIQAANPKLAIEYIYAPQMIDKDLLQKTIQSVDQPMVYVSGPEPMVEAFTAVLTELGVQEQDVKADYFPGYEAF